MTKLQTQKDDYSNRVQEYGQALQTLKQNPVSKGNDKRMPFNQNFLSVCYFPQNLRKSAIISDGNRQLSEGRYYASLNNNTNDMKQIP